MGFSIILKGFTVSESPGLWQNMPKHPIGRRDSGCLKLNNECMVLSVYSLTATTETVYVLLQYMVISTQWSQCKRTLGYSGVGELQFHCIWFLCLLSFQT